MDRSKSISRGLNLAGISLLAAVMLASFSIYLAPHFGWRVDGLRSGSMSPYLKAGDMVVTRPVLPESLQVDDVIVFRVSNKTSNMICHRVLSVTNTPSLTFETKGDANARPDPFVVPANEVVGKFAFHLPFLGNAVRFLQTGSGLILFLLLPGMLLTAWCFNNLKYEIIKLIRTKGKSK